MPAVILATSSKYRCVCVMILLDRYLPIGLAAEPLEYKHVLLGKDKLVLRVAVKSVKELLSDNRQILPLVCVQDDVLELLGAVGLRSKEIQIVVVFAQPEV